MARYEAARPPGRQRCTNGRHADRAGSDLAVENKLLVSLALLGPAEEQPLKESAKLFCRYAESRSLVGEGGDGDLGSLPRSSSEILGCSTVSTETGIGGDRLLTAGLSGVEDAGALTQDSADPITRLKQS